MRERIREFMQGHIKESIVCLIIGVLCLYILLVLKMALWQKGLVVVILIFGAFEVISKMHGKKSLMEGLQKGIGQAQSGMKMPDFSQSMQGFGPFQRRRF